MQRGGVLAARVLSGPAALWAARVLLAGYHAAVALETLQCKGPVSTQDSSCHTTGDLTGPRDRDFQVKGYTFSEPFHLIVSYDWLILQAPVMPLFEGDPLVLRCQAWQDWPLTQVTFYRDGSALGPSAPSRELSIAALRKADSGRYHCSAMFRGPGPGSLETASPMAVTVRATLEKPKLSLHPPWTTIFKGESVTLRCDGARPLVLELRPVSTLWYLGHLLLPSHRTSIEVQAPGVYRCQTRGAPVSDPVHLSVSNDWLILQAPYAAVFEGEPLVLRCRGWRDKAVYRLHYYRDGRAVRRFASSANYTVPQARAGDSGRYQCSGTMRVPVESAPMFSATVAVTVQELFPAPVLRVARRAQGGGVVLRCDTQLHPRTRAPPLRFAFYKYSRAVRGFGPAAEYTVPEPEAEELESHWCEAATASRSVRKRSAWLQLPGRGPAADAPTAAPRPQAAAWVPGNKPPSSREPLGSASGLEATSIPNATAAGPQVPAGRAAPACARLEAPGPDVDQLLREMRLLRGLLSRVLELQGAQASPGRRVTPQLPAPRSAGTLGTPGTPATSPARS